MYDLVAEAAARIAAVGLWSWKDGVPQSQSSVQDRDMVEFAFICPKTTCIYVCSTAVSLQQKALRHAVWCESLDQHFPFLFFCLSPRLVFQVFFFLSGHVCESLKHSGSRSEETAPEQLPHLLVWMSGDWLTLEVYAAEGSAPLLQPSPLPGKSLGGTPAHARPTPQTCSKEGATGCFCLF